MNISNFRSDNTLPSSPDTSTKKTNENNYYQVFVRGFEGKTICLGTNNKFTRDSTITKLKQAVSDRSSLDIS